MIKNNVIIKKITLVLLVIVMTSNFVIPNYVYAESFGEKLVGGFFHLLAYLGDVVIAAIQKLMIGDSYTGPDNSKEIRYSPGIIFSNTVPALDINFLEPMDPVEYRENGAAGQKVKLPESLYEKLNKNIYDCFNAIMIKDRALAWYTSEWNGVLTKYEDTAKGLLASKTMYYSNKSFDISTPPKLSESDKNSVKEEIMHTYWTLYYEYANETR